MSKLEKLLKKERRDRKGYHLPYHKCQCGRLTKSAMCQRCKRLMLEVVEGRQSRIGDF